MKTLHVYRHSLTRKGADRAKASHLSAEGVRRARVLGATLPDMSWVAVGSQPRHLETAIAMGFAVDEQVDWPSGYVPGEVEHQDQWQWDQPFVHYAALLNKGGGLAAVVNEHLSQWRRILSLIPDGADALVVSSGGSIEPVLVTAAPHEDHSRWGTALHQLHGAVLTVGGAGEFTSVRLVR